MAEDNRQWMKYEPQGRDTKLDTKMNLRNGIKAYGLIRAGPCPIKARIPDDYGDDIYVLEVEGENFSVISREMGQRTKREEVFPQEEAGTFFLARPDQKKQIEKILAERVFL